MTDQRYDKEFEAFLAGESALDERYTELGSEEPLPELDALILAEARNEVKVHRLKFGPRGGWLKPVALAATVLLSLSLVMNIVVDAPVRFEQIVTESTQEPARLDAEQTVSGWQEKKIRLSEQPSMSGVEEITVTARKRTDNEPQSQDDTMMDVPESVSASAPEAMAQTTDLDTALLIVSEYVAAAVSGSVEADVKVSRFMDKEERAQTAAPGLAAADRATAASDDLQSKDNPELLLRNIERLNISGASAEAGALLDEFLLRYPAHPVSVKIHQRNY
jgi:hypothetical protein